MEILKRYDNIDVFLKSFLSIDIICKLNGISNPFEINENDYLTLVKSKNFSDELLNKMIMINSECEIMENNAITNGLSDKAIEYLKLRGLLEKVSELKLSEIEINTFNELGENYTKILKK